jgi:putative acetyltransferase
MIRLATNDDREEIIQLIDAVLREYGDQIFLDDADADLHDIAANYFASGGCFWVLELDQSIVGTHATRPDTNSPGVCLFRRLYLHPDFRGTRWGSELMQVTIDWARQHGFAQVQFWSDTRFARAHRFFEKFGFKRDGRVRQMNDGYQPYEEYFFSLAIQSPPRGEPSRSAGPI